MLKQNAKKTSIIVILLAVFLASSLNIISIRSEIIAPIGVDYDALFNDLNMTRVSEHVEVLSKLGSRVTGYDGHKAAADYIAGEFAKYGQVERQEFTVLVPMDHGSNITVKINDATNRIITAYTVWPNSIQTSFTPPGGIEGPLIYVGTGELEKFDGLTVNGSIVLMDFNSGDNWINAAKLGAKAVIFIAPTTTTYFEAIEKFSLIPIYFPRVYVSGADGEILKNFAGFRDVVVNIKSNMRYEEVIAENVIVIINGSDPSKANEVIAICAHYDTWSVIPALAPGADEATAVGALIELAKYFHEHPPLRTVMLIALSGHWEGLVGAREFVDTYYFAPEVVSGEKKIWMLLGMDFSTDNDEVALLNNGHFYRFGRTTRYGAGGEVGQAGQAMLPKYTSWFLPQIQTVYLPKMGETYERKFSHGIRASGWWAAIPVPYMLDTEPFVSANGIGVTFRTNRVYRLNWGHPFNTLDKINWNNLETQFRIAAGVIVSFANEPNIGLEWNLISPQRIYFRATGGTGGTRGGLTGFATLKGQVLWYNETRGWYDGVPNAIVRIKGASTLYPFSYILAKSGQNGSFEVHGLGPGPQITSWSIQASAPGYYMDAFVINEVTSQIEMAPDMGIFGSQAMSFWISAVTHPTYGTTVVFNCSSVVLFDLVDPDLLTPPVMPDPRFASYSEVWRIRDFTVLPYSFITLSQFDFYGVDFLPSQPICMIFIPRGEPFAISIKSGNRILGFLVNSSATHPEGAGYKIDRRELHMTLTTFRILHDVYTVTSHRYSSLNVSLIRSITSEYFLSDVNEQYIAAKKALEQKQYSEVYKSSTTGWIHILKAYSSTMDLINDVSVTSLSYFFLCVTFILVFERLAFSARGRKRFVVLMVEGFIFILVFYFLHPGLRLISNASVALIAVVITIFFTLIIGMFASEIISISKRLRLEIRGTHFVETGRTSTIFESLNIGVQSMRRRKMRTILTLITLIIICFSITTFTSTAIVITPRITEISGVTPLYQGIYILRGVSEPENFLSPLLVDYIRSVAPSGTSVAPRAWYYPESDLSQSVRATVSHGSKSQFITAVLGLAPEEEALGYLDGALTGLWFTDGQTNVCVLPSIISDNLGVTVGDIVNFQGVNLTVIGIVKEDILNNLVDMDNKGWTPLNPNRIPILSYSPSLSQEESYEHLIWQDILIVPYDFAVSLGAYVGNIAIKVDDPEILYPLAETLSMTLDLSIYVGKQLSAEDWEVRYYTRFSVFNVAGWDMLMVPLLITILTAFMTTFGNVKEKMGDFIVYSALGLSPSNAAIMIFVEAGIYACISLLPGYLLGFAVNYMLIASGFLPREYIVNFSSFFVLIALGLTLLSVMASAIYPAMMASKAITPSLERKWRLTTRPVGDIWNIPLPFVFEGEDTLKGLIEYMREFFSSYTVETGGQFVVRSLDKSADGMTLNATVALGPREGRLTQLVKMTALKMGDRYTVSLELKWLGGARNVFQAANYAFIDTIRKQFLIWQGFSKEEKTKYIKKATG